MKNVTSCHQRLFERQKTYCIIYVVFYLNFISLNIQKKKNQNLKSKDPRACIENLNSVLNPSCRPPMKMSYQTYGNLLSLLFYLIY